VTRTDANAFHKIVDGDGFWHRMGDVGYLDDQDRFWFCGRKSHRLRTGKGTMFTIPCEAIINTHKKIYRSAQQVLIDELKEISSRHWQTDQIEHFLLHRSLPVDIRHNSKIFREQLRGWAADELKTETGQVDANF